MFAGVPNKPLPYETPWTASLEERLAALQARRPCRALWLYDKPDASTFRYRVFNIVESLMGDPEARVAASWFTEPEIPVIEDVVEGVDVVVLCRFPYTPPLARLVARAKAAGVRVLFDCDDLVFDSRYVPLIAETLDQDIRAPAVWDFWFAYVGRREASMRLCDGGIATNPFLAKKLSDALGGKPVGIVPNFLNRRQQRASLELLKMKRESAWKRDGRVTIGYFSGTPSHNRDFSIPALVRLLETNPHVDLRVVGFLDIKDELSDYAERIEVLPFEDFMNLQRLIAGVEVNIVPLQQNDFTDCKSELKFFEAACVGTWTVATPTNTYRAAISHGETGLLAHAHEWDRRLQQAVELASSPSVYAAAAERAAQFAFSSYGWNGFSGRIAAALQEAGARYH